MAAAFRKPKARKLPLLRGLLRITGDTLEGPRETDAFDVVNGPGGDVGIVLLDVQTRHAESGDVTRALLEAYASVRPPTAAERAAFGDELRFAACRFAVTRITDVHLKRDAGAPDHLSTAS